MAKQTALQLVNKVLKNLGESTVSALTSLSGLSLLVFDAINEVLYDLAIEYKFKPLETNTSISLVTATSTYTKPSTLMNFDRESFRYNESSKVHYYTPQRFDREYPAQTNSGAPPTIIFDFQGYFNVYPIPVSAANGKTIKYRAWVNPTPIDTASPSGTCWIPEGFDLTLLADYVTFKILEYKHNERASIYYQKVWGDGGYNEGSLHRFRRIWGSEILSTDMVVEPMEGNNARTGIVQNPITG